MAFPADFISSLLQTDFAVGLNLQPVRDPGRRFSDYAAFCPLIAHSTGFACLSVLPIYDDGCGAYRGYPVSVSPQRGDHDMRNSEKSSPVSVLLQLGIISLTFLAAAVAPVRAQQVTGKLGSADATTTIDGRQ